VPCLFILAAANLNMSDNDNQTLSSACIDVFNQPGDASR
jgi:hypothetical protein